MATLHCSASALQTSLNALGLIAMLQLPRSDDKIGGTKSSEIKEVNEFREKITKFPNLLKFFIRGKTSSVCVYSDLGCCRKAVKEKISTKGQARLKPKVDIYYFNDSQSYPKSASEISETKFTAFCRFLLAARHSLRAVSALAPQRRFAESLLGPWSGVDLISAAISSLILSYCLADSAAA